MRMVGGPCASAQRLFRDSCNGFRPALEDLDAITADLALSETSQTEKGSSIWPLSLGRIITAGRGSAETKVRVQNLVASPSMIGAQRDTQGPEGPGASSCRTTAAHLILRPPTSYAATIGHRSSGDT